MVLTIIHLLFDKYNRSYQLPFSCLSVIHVLLKVLEQQHTGFYENVELVNGGGGPLISLHI
jgi:hypothetical protein